MDLNLPCNCDENIPHGICTRHSPLGRAITLLGECIDDLRKSMRKVCTCPKEGLNRLDDECPVHGLAMLPTDSAEPLESALRAEYTRAGLCAFSWSQHHGAYCYPHVYKDARCIRCEKEQPEVF